MVDLGIDGLFTDAKYELLAHIKYSKAENHSRCMKSTN